jgi:succinate dehydrogenase / fumarate reductase cytochrome b subunit
MPNMSNAAYRWRENRMYTFQRWSGIFVFFFLAYHTATTSIASKISGNHEMIEYAAWQTKLTEHGYIWLIVYMLGVLASCYHLSYGIWNFCIRWGITISEKAQMRMQRFAVVCFVALTLLGWGALAGFLLHKPEAEVHVVMVSAPNLLPF